MQTTRPNGRSNKSNNEARPAIDFLRSWMVGICLAIGVAFGSSHKAYQKNDPKIGSDFIIWICDWYLSTLAWQKHHNSRYFFLAHKNWRVFIVGFWDQDDQNIQLHWKIFMDRAQRVMGTSWFQPPVTRKSQPRRHVRDHDSLRNLKISP